MKTDVRIRVFYPSRAGATVVLRTELDWDQDVTPTRVDARRGLSEFTVPCDRPYFYFKPCLLEDGGLRWSVGSNYLAIRDAPDGRELYPHFQGGASGQITPELRARYAGQGDRAFRVYLPPGYDENTLKRYPVLYMHDGANLFFPDEAFAGTPWKVDTHLEFLDAMNVIDKVIVVGVYAQDRMSEYTQPGYERYGRFLTESLKPAIDQGFRTLRGPANTALMGSSLGGVVSMFLAWEYPNVFGKAACLSSTFGYRDDLFDRVRHEQRRDVRFYLDSGCPGDNFEDTRIMRDLLLEQGYGLGRDLLYFAFPHAEHNEPAWALRSHIPFQFFFGKQPVDGAAPLAARS